MSNKMLNDPEFAEIIEESEKELETDVDKMFLDMIGFYRKEIRNLNTDDCHELTSKLKNWFIWCQR